MLKKLLSLTAGLLLMGGIAHATPITFSDTTLFYATGTDAKADLLAYGGTSVNFLEGTGDFVYWRHQFSFDPPAGKILSGSLIISLKDDYDPCAQEYAFGMLEGGKFFFGEVDTQKYGFKVDTLSLADGFFNVFLSSVCGDFYITQSKLTICYEPAPVPEPGTITLLGAGLLGLGFYGRRRMKK